jgi:hypothetical protein
MQVRSSQYRPFVHPRPRSWYGLLMPALIVALVVAAMAIWPARLAANAHEFSGLATLVAFMGIAFALAVVLGVAAVKMLGGDET